MKKLANILLTLTLILGAICFITLLWWSLYPYDPMRIDKFILNKTTAAQGERLCFTFEGEKLLPVAANVVLELQNGETIQLMNYYVNNPPGPILKPRSFNIPYHVKPGEYKVKWNGDWQVNPIRHIKKTVESDWITITENTRLQGMRGETGRQGIQGIHGEKGDKGDKGKKGGITFSIGK